MQIQIRNQILNALFQGWSGQQSDTVRREGQTWAAWDGLLASRSFRELCTPEIWRHLKIFSEFLKSGSFVTYQFSDACSFVTWLKSNNIYSQNPSEPNIISVKSYSLNFRTTSLVFRSAFSIITKVNQTWWSIITWCDMFQIHHITSYKQAFYTELCNISRFFPS